MTFVAGKLSSEQEYIITSILEKEGGEVTFYVYDLKEGSFFTVDKAL